MSGADFEHRQIRKGAAEAIRAFVETEGGGLPKDVQIEVAKSRAPAVRRSSSPTASACLARSS